jgi:hypothetical protein
MTVSVNISDIAQLNELQFREKLDLGKIQTYAHVYSSEEHSMPPIHLALIDGALVLVDGWHRLAALKKLGRTEAEAIIEEMTIEQAIGKAALCNLKHGVPLSRREIKTAFIGYMKANLFIDDKGKAKSSRILESEFYGVVKYKTMLEWLKHELPEIYHNHYAKEYKPVKGFSPKERTSLVPELTDYIYRVKSTFRLVKDEDERGALIEYMEKALKEMKEGGGWRYPTADF